MICHKKPNKISTRATIVVFRVDLTSTTCQFLCCICPISSSSIVVVIIGLFQVELSFFDHVGRGARVTRVTMPTAQYLATRKILLKLLRIESHHHDNGNPFNRTSMVIDLFNTNLLDEI
jgi:hypothetical protein